MAGLKRIILVLMLAVSSCLADEIVLKNGKILKGEVISEDPEVIILKDSSGIRLQIKKNRVESLKKQERNEKQKAITSPADEQESESRIPDKPKTKTRVYRKEDLEKMPELSIIGDESIPDDVALRNEYEDRAIQEKEAEASWNEEALRIDDQIREAKDIYESSKQVCDKPIPGIEDLREGDYVRLTPEQYEERRRYACVEAEAAAKDLKTAEMEYEDLLEEARKKGIPPGWVDPDRIRN